MNICVFCSSKHVAQEYKDAAEEFVTLLAKKGHTLIWGGSDTGLMHFIAQTAQDAGARTIGVSVEIYRSVASKKADELVVAHDLAERKATMFRRADVLVVMVGGTGTLDELTEVMELQKHDGTRKPVIVLNTGGFYDGLREQLRRMEQEGFLYYPLQNGVFFAATPKEAMGMIEQHAQ